MSKLTQSAAVVLATKLILGDDFKPGVPVLSYITKEQRAAVVDEVTRMLVEGEVDISAEAMMKYGDKLRSKYVAGMVTNWFTKGKELNGGVKHEAKNPGSRVGASDEKIKTMRQLRAHLVASGGSAEAIASVDAAIAERQAELKKVTKEMDLSKFDFTIFNADRRREFAVKFTEQGFDVSNVPGLSEFLAELESEAA